MVSISVIIVSYNTKDLIVQCVRSIMTSIKLDQFEVILVDNASSDGTVERIRQEYPGMTIIQNDRNIGYASANNQGLRMAQGKILVLLNSDTIVNPDTFYEIANGFQRNTNAGAIGPMLINDDGSIQPSFAKFLTLWSEFLFQTFLFKFVPSPLVLGQKILPVQEALYTQSHPVDWVTGACLAIRREVYEQVGGLSGDLFMYGEDMEWCWRIRKAGFQVVYWPDARVTHLSGRSSKKNYESWIRNYTYGNLYFAYHNLKYWHLRLLGALVCAGSLLRISLWGTIGLLQPDRKDEITQRVKGYKIAIALGLKAFLKGQV